MANHELLPLVADEAGLWLAGIAACAGLALAWRYWMTRRGLRNRALQVLGHVKPTSSAMWPGMRYAGVIAVAIVTIFVLTPTTPGAGDTAPAAEAMTPVATEPASAVVIVELRSEGATIVVQGTTVEIHLASGAPTLAGDGVQTYPSGDRVAQEPTATAPSSALPEGME